MFTRSAAFATSLVLLLGITANVPNSLGNPPPHARAFVCPDPPDPSMFSVSVTPDGGSASWQENTNTHKAVFTIQNTGICNDTYSFSASSSGPITVVSLSLGSALIGRGLSRVDTVTYNVGSPGSGTLTFVASGMAGDQGDYNVTVTLTPYRVSVTPDGGTTPNRATNTSYADSFWVQNTGANADTYILSCSGSNTTCGTISPAGPITLQPNAQQGVAVNYTTGTNPGTGSLNLQAASSQTNDAGNYTVPIVNYSVAVTPDGATAPQRWAGNGGYSETFTVRNTGGAQDTYTLTCTAVAPVTCAAVNPVSPASVTLASSDSAHVTVNYSVGSPGTGQLKVRAGGLASDTGYYSVTVAGGPPVVDESPYNFTKQDYTRCAQACFAATYMQSTVPYFSLDAPRNVTLSYNGDRVDPTKFVHVNVSPSPGYPGTPTEYRLQVKVNGVNVTFLNGEQVLRFAYPGSSPARLGGQFSVSSYATGKYPMDIVVSAVYATGLFDQVVSTTLVVVNETSAPIARGWTIPGIQRLYSADGGSVLITEGDGSAVYFQRFWPPPAGEFSYIFLNAWPDSLGWTRMYPDSTRVIFDTLGRMSKVVDRFNNVTTVWYDASGRVYQIKDPRNLTTTLTYDANGLDYITDPMGRVTQVTVDANKRLTLIQDPDNVGTAFGYDASNRLSAITDRRGRTTTFGYDPQSGQLTTITSPAVPVVNADGSETTASLVSTLESWKKKGVPYGSTSPAVSAPLRDTVYARTTDPGGHVTRFTVNQWGTPAVVTSPINMTDSTFFDSNGLPSRRIYSTGAVDSTIYNSSGLLTYAKPFGLNARNITYTGWAQVDSVWGSQTPSLKNFIGANGRVDSTRTWGAAGAAVTRFTYETDGRVNKVTDPESHLAGRMWYAGIHGNRSRDSLPGGRITTYTYDTFGRRTSTAAPAVAVHVQSYDALNRVTRDSMAGLPATVYAYDSLFLRSVTDPKGQVYSFGYNALGWVTAQTDPANHADTLKYDRDGLLRRSKNRRGHVVNYTYDAGHRQLSKSGDITDATSWSYSSNGRIMSATSPWVVDSQFFGISGMLDSIRTKLNSQTFVQRFVYTGSGALDSVNVAGGGITFMARKYVWDTQRNTLNTIRLSGGEPTSLESNRDGQLTASVFPGGDRVSIAPTTVHTDASISTDAVYAQASDQYLTFDPANRISRLIDGTGLGGTDFFYDSYGRLRGDSSISYQGPGNPCTGDPPPIIDDNGQTCSYSGTWSRNGGQAFSYDSVGNRRDQSGDYGPANRIRQFAGCVYVTDSLADGNVLSRTCGSQIIRFYWSAESRLIAAKIVGSDSLDFRYDEAGRLIRRDVNGAAQSYFLWQGSNLLAELNASATGKVAEYSYYPGLDNPHAIIIGTTPYFSHEDVVGNVVALTDDAAALQRSYVHDPWGQLIGGSDFKPFGNIDRTRFKGALWMGADIDMYYMRNRWYEPKAGRFLSEDPMGISGDLNLYTYAAGDPINGSDPTGTCSYYITYTSGYSDGHVDYVIQQTGADCSSEVATATGTVMGPGFGGSGRGRGFPAASGVVNLGTQGNACWGEFFKLTANAALDFWAVTGIGEGALLLARGVGKFAAGALLNTAARSAATVGFDVAGKRAFLSTVAAGARAFAELGGSEIAQGGFRAAEGYAPDATFVGAATVSSHHSLSFWDFVPGHGTLVAFREYRNCLRGVQ